MTVTTLRRNGLRLARSDWPEPVRGELVIRDVDGERNSYRRCVRLAELWQVGLQSRRLAIPPIADPVILATHAGGFILAGIELRAAEKGVAENRQVWLCVPV